MMIDTKELDTLTIDNTHSNIWVLKKKELVNGIRIAITDDDGTVLEIWSMNWKDN